MIKKTLLICAGLAASLALMTGCEWTAGGGSGVGQTWNDEVTSMDFSGVYKAADGGVLVRQPGAGSSSTTNTTTSTNSVSSELLATGNGTSTAFAGTLAHPPPMRGTLTIVVGGYRFADPGSASAGTVALTVTPSDGTAGTINLDTGAWALSFASPIANGTQILGSYQYLSTTNVVNSNQGNHGNPIYSMVIYQQGNTVQIVDDCASKYEGYLGSSSITNTMVQLYVTGYSQGYNVTICGTLSSGTLKGTFIEDGGYAADISGVRQ